MSTRKISHAKPTASYNSKDSQKAVEENCAMANVYKHTTANPTPEIFHISRFKIDRKKLVKMMKAESGIAGMNGAEYFFDNIMKTTETYIKWPCNLLIGRKNRRNPHVRVEGAKDKVRQAKQRILADLDSGCNRVLIKMTVAHSDHQHIIGCGGNNVNRIMKDTATYIHFMERSNPTEYSNQVSVGGSLEGVEQARSFIRSHTPLQVSFELPPMAAGRARPNEANQYIIWLQQKYILQITFQTYSGHNAVLILAKGGEKKMERVQEAMKLLINHFCGNKTSTILVNMQLEISPQHHEIVKGKNNENLTKIKQQTNTNINFPNLFQVNDEASKRSLVTITGTIENAYKARQLLLGVLPIALVFDYDGDQNEAAGIMNLSTKYGVNITFRRKQRQTILSIIIKGVEKFLDKIYEARHEILGLTTPLIKPEIPETYFMQQDRAFNAEYRTRLTALMAGRTAKNRFSKQKTANDNSSLSSESLNQINRQQFEPVYHSTPTGFFSTTQMHTEVYDDQFSRPPQKSQQKTIDFVQAMQEQQAHLLWLQQQRKFSSDFYKLSPPSNYNNHTSEYRSYSSSSSSSSTTSSNEMHNTRYGNVLAANKHLYGKGLCLLTQGSTSPDSNYSSVSGSTHSVSLYSDDVLLGSDADGEAAKNVVGHNQNFDIDLQRPDRPNTNWMVTGILKGVEQLAASEDWNATSDEDDATTSIGLEHYIKMFRLTNLDWKILDALSADGLIELGFPAFGARNKMLTATYNPQANEVATPTVGLKDKLRFANKCVL